MNPPRLVQGCALLLWGWQVQLLEFALPMAVLLELRHLTRRRWELERSDFYRVADLTSVLLVGLVIYLANSVPMSHFLISLVELSPILVFPLTLVLSFSTKDKLPLDVVFYSLRKQPGDSGEWDLQYIYIGVCLVAMGTATDAHALFLPAAVVIICWSLWPGRPGRYTTPVTLTVILVALGMGTLLHMGLHQGHLVVKDRVTKWIVDTASSRAKADLSITGIGRVGQLKLSNAIHFRVKRSERSTGPLYLREASYDFMMRNEWHATRHTFLPLPKIDQFSWRLPGEAHGTDRITVYQDGGEDSALVPIPPGARVIKDYPAVEMKRSFYGTVQAVGIESAPAYTVEYSTPRGSSEDTERMDIEKLDTRVPDEYRDLMTDAVGPTISYEMPPSVRIDLISRYFDDFSYSLYQSEEVREDPIRYFLQESRSGHCEYFATATVLMLRAAGIPARYVTGYVAQEYDPITELYLVRKRHAHAWAVAHVDGRWQIVDTTPGNWLQMETAAVSRASVLSDLVSNLLFNFRVWRQVQKLDDYTFWLYSIVFVLILVLAYRLSRSDQVLLDPESQEQTRTVHGTDSPFFRIEEWLESGGLTRLKGEPLLHWTERIEHRELHPIIREHYALRFDPAGISKERKQELSAAVEDWIGPRSTR